MLSRIDRLQLAVPDAAPVAARWAALLGAQEHGRDRLATLGARRTRLRLGDGWIELLEPDGTGIVDTALQRRGAHLFAAGAASPDLPALRAHLASQGVQPPEEAGQLHLSDADTGVPGFRVVLSAEAPQPVVGDIDFLYEATLLAGESAPQCRRLTALFALPEGNYSTIVSETFGYDGTLTLFHPDRLHRFEVIRPTRAGTTMARFLERTGPALYMCFAETDRMLAIEQRVRDAGLGLTVDRPAGRSVSVQADQLWLHPPTLGGMMLGLSRPSMAWRWSGRPERVVGID
ncbi:MAG: hypothetical protein AB7F36_08400 [Reyranellaceae bacterium]